MAEEGSISEREFDARLNEVRRAVDLAHASAGQHVELREYVESLFAAEQRANEMAEREREKAACALASERDRSAQALTLNLAKQIEAGDTHLRQHIDQQVAQIEAALVAANRETLVRHDSSEKAIAKAEAANERRFDSVNAFRAQLADQTTTFLPREVSDAQFADIRKQSNSNTARLDTLAGKSVGSSATIGMMLAVATLVLGLLVLIANNI